MIIMAAITVTNITPVQAYMQPYVNSLSLTEAGSITLSNDSKKVTNPELDAKSSTPSESTAPANQKEPNTPSDPETVDDNTTPADDNDTDTTQELSENPVNNDNGSAEEQSSQGSGESITTTIDEGKQKKLRISSVVFSVVFAVIIFGFYQCYKLFSIAQH